MTGNGRAQFCTFFVDGLCFGVDVLAVQEVLRFQDLTPVPLAQPTVRGLINLRGQIVVAIDMRRRLDRPSEETGAPPMNVVVCTDEGVVSFLVDEIGDVLEVDAEAFETPPETIDDSVRALITGVYKLPDRLMMVLDTEHVADLDSAA